MRARSAGFGRIRGWTPRLKSASWGVACALLGLATTVAVAWALALWLPHNRLWIASSPAVVVEGEPLRLMEALEFGRGGMLRRQWRAKTTIGRWPPMLPFIQPTRPAPLGHAVVAGPRWGAPPTTRPSRLRGYEDARGWP